MEECLDIIDIAVIACAYISIVRVDVEPDESLLQEQVELENRKAYVLVGVWGRLIAVRGCEPDICIPNKEFTRRNESVGEFESSCCVELECYTSTFVFVDDDNVPVRSGF